MKLSDLRKATELRVTRDDAVRTLASIDDGTAFVSVNRGALLMPMDAELAG